MARNLGTDLNNQVTATTLHPVFLIKLVFDSGDLNLSSAYYNLTYNSDTYIGAGALISLGDQREVGDLQAVGVSIGLSALSPDILQYALTDTNEYYQNRLLYIYLGALQPDGFSFYGTPHQTFKGRIDTMSISDDGEDVAISVQAENIHSDFERSNVRFYTPEDHKLDHTDDTFFDSVAALQDKKILWGIPRT
jgi:hypothetical protein